MFRSFLLRSLSQYIDEYDALQRENAKLQSKLKEKEDQVADLQGQIPAQGELVVARFKESDELKAMLKMMADLLAAREAKERTAKSKAATEEAPEIGGSSEKDAEGTDEDDVPIESSGNEEEEPGQS
ncbi:hypothetical protein ACLB2K_052268 [Fragaria x ananassa]